MSQVAQPESQSGSASFWVPPDRHWVAWREWRLNQRSGTMNSIPVTWLTVDTADTFVMRSLSNRQSTVDPFYQLGDLSLPLADTHDGPTIVVSNIPRGTVATMHTHNMLVQQRLQVQSEPRHTFCCVRHHPQSVFKRYLSRSRGPRRVNEKRDRAKVGGERARRLKTTYIPSWY